VNTSDHVLKAAVEVLNGQALLAIPIYEWERLKRIEHAAKRLIHDVSVGEGERVTATHIRLQELTLDLRLSLGQPL
jgi:hypothetical protein